MSIHPLRRVLTLQSLAAIILPFAVMLLLGFFWILPHASKDVGERQILLARAVGMQVESHLETGAAIVRAAASLRRGNQHLESLLGSTDAMGSLYEIAPDGTVLDVALKQDYKEQHDDQIGINLSRNPLFLEVTKRKKALWSETFLSVIYGGLVVAYGAPGEDATVIGEVDLALLTKFLQRISTEKELLILIVDHKGQVVADNNGLYTAQQLNIGNIQLVRDGIRSDADTTGQFDFSGSSMTGSIIQIKSVDWHVIVAKTNASLYRTPIYISLIVLAGILIAVCCGVVTSAYLAQRLASRFDELTGHAQDIAQGKVISEWPLSSVTEFNQLSRSLRTMADTLHQQETVLRESEEKYRLDDNNIPLRVALI
ncbi:MAG: cache and HAMP domain-containing protein, partial [Deltaproteobacteria bacterium]|nr:cache and HAMP domain-containing protein [Deltaproteobacteria bacterium]